MHKAAAKHSTRLIFPISFRCQPNYDFNFFEPLWYGRSWPQSQSEREKSNLNTFILSNYNTVSWHFEPEMETPCTGHTAAWVDSKSAWACRGPARAVRVPKSSANPELHMGGFRYGISSCLVAYERLHILHKEIGVAYGYIQKVLQIA